MANLLKAIGDGAIDSIKSPLKVVKHAVKGEGSEAWDALKSIPGNQERANSEIFNAAGIRGWVGDHPGESVAGAIGAVMGGTALAGAMGGGMGGAAGGAANAGSTFSLGNIGSYFNPTTAGHKWSNLFGMDQTGDIGKLFNGVEMDDDILGMIADAEEGGAVVQPEKKMDFAKMSQVLKNVQGNMPKQPQVSQASHRGGGGGRMDKSLYENPLLVREFQQMYQEPLYKNLV